MKDKLVVDNEKWKAKKGSNESASTPMPKEEELEENEEENEEEDENENENDDENAQEMDTSEIAPESQSGEMLTKQNISYVW